MRRLSLCLVLLPSFAFAEMPKFDTLVSMRVDGENKALFTAFDAGLHTSTGTRVDACWHKAGHVRATVRFDDGKVRSVEITRIDDSAAKACVTQVLEAVVLAGPTGHSVAEIDLEASARVARVGLFQSKDRKVLDTLVDKNLSADLSKFTAMDSPPPSGDLTADEIDHVIKARAGEFRACYQKELARDPKLAGKVVMRFKIKEDGTTTNVSVASTTLKSPAVEGCLIKQIERLKFPAKAGATVNYPFVFAQGG